MKGRFSYGFVRMVSGGLRALGDWFRTVGSGLRLALAGLRDLFFVRSCAVCGGALETGAEPGLTRHLICDHCLGDIPLTYFWDYSENAAMDALAGRCHVYNAASLFFYRHGSDYCEIVRRCKYGGDIPLGLWAGEMLGRYLASGGLYADVQAVVPVPLHPLKKWRRGFNQAEVIARGIAAGLSAGPGRDVEGSTSAHVVPVCGASSSLKVESRLLYRRRYTATQTRRGAIGRASNVAGAFGVRKDVLERMRASGIRHVLIVDDVLTTGATLSACIRLLENTFTVSAATLGFVDN